MSQPKLITKPFASDALPGYVNEIPKENPSGAPEQNASWAVGFPPITMTDIDDGGLPPNGEDMNGVLRAITEHNLFIGGGGVYKFTSEYVAEMGGYSKGAVLISDDKTALWMSIQDNNTQNFNGSTKTQWRRVAFTELDSTLASIQNALNTKADKSITITAGDGLTGGGTLAGNRVFAVNKSVVRTDRTITAGTGLSGGGNLSANRTLSVNYGTTAGTSAQGNDARITGAAQKAANLSDLASSSAARQNLGLGTAATKDVGESSGNVMQVGSFGVGVNFEGFTVNAIDINTTPDNFYAATLRSKRGWYFLSSANGGAVQAFNGPSAYGYFFGVHNDTNESRYSVRFFTPAGGDDIYMQKATSGSTWGPFVKIVTSGSLAQSPGQLTDSPMSQKAVTDFVNKSSLGVGQSYQKPVRNPNVTYVNTRGRTIFVIAEIEERGAGVAYVEVSGINLGRINIDGSSSQVRPTNFLVSFPVPNTQSYRIVTTGEQSIISWSELT